MYISSAHRPASNQISVDITDEQYVQHLGEFTATIGDTRIHLTYDEADRLMFQLATALQDLHMAREEKSA